MPLLREKIGQMLIMGFTGTILHENSDVVQWLKQDGLGGVILFDYDLPNKIYGKNMVSKDQIIQLNQQLQKYESRGLPLFIAIDYEGGAVDRLRSLNEFGITLSAIEQANLSIDDFDKEIDKMCNTLVSLGFNLNFAPIVDLNLQGEYGIIGKLGRSFAKDPQTVIHFAKRFVDRFNEHGILCCYKHFPGHGSATGDTHEGFVDVTSTYKDEELEPYRVLVKNKTQSAMIMTAHVINRQLDPSGLPATLSYPILTELLRNQLGFNGVIISDDLQMHAISKQYSLEESLQLTINAGADMLIFGNQLGWHSATEVIDCIESLVTSNRIPSERIDEAYQRVCALKCVQHKIV